MGKVANRVAPETGLYIGSQTSPSVRPRGLDTVSPQALGTDIEYPLRSNALSAKSVLGGRVALTSITQVGSNSPDKGLNSITKWEFLGLDVGLNEHSKQWKGESGAEVQSEKLQGVGRERENYAESSHLLIDLFLGPLACKAVGVRRTL